AVPKGIPPDPKQNHLAVHVEDHPLEYFKFAGEIPKGEYGGGQVLIWDEGTYDPVKWSDREVMIDLHGHRLKGRYVLFKTNGENWMIHRMDPPQDPDRKPMPQKVEPMLARLSPKLPAPDAAWGFEFKWDGIRAVAFVEGGRVRLQSRTGEDITPRYPEIHAMGRALGSREVILDGEIVALDEKGRPSFEEIQQRMGLTSGSEIRRKMKDVPVTYMAFDLLWQDGHSLMERMYTDRRKALGQLKLAGASWQTPPSEKGGGQAMKEASARAGLEGVMAKKLDSKYEPGRRTGAWPSSSSWNGPAEASCARPRSRASATTNRPKRWCAKVAKETSVEVQIDGRTLKLTNLEKVLYLEVGFTKAQVIDYYTRIAPVLLPHTHDHPL